MAHQSAHAGEPNNDTSAIERFKQIAKVHGLSDAEVAGLAGVSPHTVRVIRLASIMPRHARCRRAVVEFVRVNGKAKSREALRAVGR